MMLMPIYNQKWRKKNYLALKQAYKGKEKSCLSLDQQPTMK